MNRILKRLAAIGLVATLLPALAALPASAAPGAQPPPTVSPNPVPLAATDFALSNGSCDGTGGAGWRVQTFIVNDGVNVGSLPFNLGSGFDRVGDDRDNSNGSIAAPLWKNNAPGTGYEPAGSPAGLINPTDLSAFDFSNAGWVLTDGRYQIGYVCLDQNSAVHAWWSRTVTVDTTPGGGSSFMIMGTIDTPSIVGVTPADGQLTIDFTGANADNWTAQASTTSGDFTSPVGTSTTATSDAQNITISGLTNGTPYFVRVVANKASFAPAPSTQSGPHSPNPTVSIVGATVTEGNAGTVGVVFTATLSGASSQTVTVVATTANGTAVAPGDYTAKTETLTFAPNDTVETFTVLANGDTTNEPNETFTVALSSPGNATVAGGAATGTITNDDPPAVSVNDVTVAEGNSGTTNATFTLSLTNPSSSTVTVNVATGDGTATSADYTALATTVTFAPGDTSKPVTVAVNGETAVEGDEQFTLSLSSPTNATLGRATGIGTITNDDTAPTTTTTTTTTVPNSGGTGEAAQGYSLVGEDGSLYAFGTAKNLGDMRGTKLNAPVIGVAYTPGGNGYWLVAKDGGIFTFGDAAFYGSMGDRGLNAPVIGMAATPTGKGYWLFAGDGGIFTFGDAVFFGSMGDQKLNAPVLNMEPLESGKGYWLVAADGGIFTFGQAEFSGSMGDQKINQPVFDMTSTDTDKGYWLIAKDGGIFSFGDATSKFYGSAVNETPRPTNIIGMDSTPGSLGYWIADANGKVYPFGNAAALGDRYQAPNPAPMIGLASVPGLKL